METNRSRCTPARLHATSGCASASARAWLVHSATPTEGAASKKEPAPDPRLRQSTANWKAQRWSRKTFVGVLTWRREREKNKAPEYLWQLC